MKCQSCGKDAEIHEGRFRPNGMWPHSTVKRYSFDCADCAVKVPIDATTKYATTEAKSKVEGTPKPDWNEPAEGPPEFERPPPDCPF